MAVDPVVKKNWIEIQKQHDVPVNAIGVKIDPTDEKALSIYRKTVSPLANGIFSAPVRDYRARLKEALVLLGIIKNSVMRPPLLPLDTAEKEKVRRLLVTAGML